MLAGMALPPALARGVNFPTFLGSNTIGTSGVGGINLPMPAGVQAGDLLIGLITHVAGSARNLNLTAGWEPLHNLVGPGSVRRVGAMWKIAGPSEPVNALVQSGSSGSWSGISLRFSGAREVEAANTSGTTNDGSFASLAPSWGEDGTLWLAVCHASNDVGTPHSVPEFFGNQITVTSGGGIASRTSVARLEYPTAHLKPGDFAITGETPLWVSATLAVRPS